MSRDGTDLCSVEAFGGELGSRSLEDVRAPEGGLPFLALQETCGRFGIHRYWIGIKDYSESHDRVQAGTRSWATCGRGAGFGTYAGTCCCG